MKTWSPLNITVLGLASSITTNIYDMSTPPPYAKDLGNLLYHSAVVGGLSVGYSMVGKRLLKMKPADLGRLDIEDSAKLVGTVALALWTQDMLVKQGIIPANIIKST